MSVLCQAEVDMAKKSVLDRMRECKESAQRAARYLLAKPAILTDERLSLRSLKGRFPDAYEQARVKALRSVPNAEVRNAVRELLQRHFGS
jgi:hypothetical protein